MKNDVEKMAMVLGLVVLVFFVGFFLARSSDRPAIEEGKVYELGYTYVVDLVVGTSDGEEIVERSRVFDFADRSMPDKSVVVPMVDANGIALVVRNKALPANRVLMVRIQIPGRTIEEVAYPAYEFVRWEYNLGAEEPQSVVPQMKPRS